MCGKRDDDMECYAALEFSSRVGKDVDTSRSKKFGMLWGIIEFFTYT